MRRATVDIDALHAFIEGHGRLFVITGAGVSTGSGIPDYRDRNGEWKRTPPATFQAFTGDDMARRRYWARSLAGWPHFRRARPNAVHRALAALETRGKVELLLTQNVDGLHQQAGNERVIDLHGRPRPRALPALRSAHAARGTAARIAGAQPALGEIRRRHRPGRRRRLRQPRLFAFRRARLRNLRRHAEAGRGVLRRERAARTRGRRQPPSGASRCGAGRRFVADGVFGLPLRACGVGGRPIAAVNPGRTRADDLLSLKIRAPGAEALEYLLGNAAGADDAPQRAAPA